MLPRAIFLQAMFPEAMFLRATSPWGWLTKGSSPPMATPSDAAAAGGSRSGVDPATRLAWPDRSTTPARSDVAGAPRAVVRAARRGREPTPARDRRPRSAARSRCRTVPTHHRRSAPRPRWSASAYIRRRQVRRRWPRDRPMPFAASAVPRARSRRREVSQRPVRQRPVQQRPVRRRPGLQGPARLARPQLARAQLARQQLARQ